MTTETQRQELSVDEAIARYPNEWIFMQVTAEDHQHAPSHGFILAHHPKRHVIQRAIMRTIAGRGGDEVYYLFQGFPRNLSFQDCLSDTDERRYRELDEIELLMLREASE